MKAAKDDKVEEVVEPTIETRPSTETPPPADAWDSDKAVEDVLYQGFVDRLQEKGDKEVSRIVKVCGLVWGIR